MRRVAAARTSASNVRYQAGYGHATGLPDGGADIVTASQALHWMEPEPTFAEVARIVRPGGIFAAVDCDWPPAMHWGSGSGLQRLHGALCGPRPRTWLHPGRPFLGQGRTLGPDAGQRPLPLRAGSHAAQTSSWGTPARLVGLALSQGQVATPLKHGVSEDEVGTTALREVAQRVLGDAPQPWYFSYRVRLGVK